MNLSDTIRWFSLVLWLYFVPGLSSQTGSKRLSEYVSHFEPLTYSTDSLHDSHIRAKRSTSRDHTLHLEFTAHGRDFKLRLKRDTKTFSRDAKLEVDGKELDLDASHIYEGSLADEPGSHCHGSIIQGIFSGTIYSSKDGKYYIEKSELYFDQPHPFHSVIYKDSDVLDSPKRLRRSAQEGRCASVDPEIRRWMDLVQNSASPSRKKREAQSQAKPHNIYAAWAQGEQNYLHHKDKRATDNPRQRTCTLFLQSDTMLWEYMTLNEGGLGYNRERAMEEITSLFATHVSGLKTIYENTVFSYESYSYTGFSFAVRRVKINTTEDCQGTLLEGNQFCRRNIDVSNFLNLNSLTNHNLYCLTYVFTYRDFTGGTLGLAWVGSPTKASGGICEKWKEYTENGRKIHKSLNTGIVTLVNYGSRVPPKVSTLTFAHEVGHNFGSPHDNGAQCVPTDVNPNDKNGNFIMFASATSGDRANNNKFSSCSIGNITLVLHAVLTRSNGKENCFVENEEAFCGNAILETDEICDCGFVTDCHKIERCCIPRQEETPNSDMCTLQSTSECSPSQGPCCTKECKKVRKPDGKVCQIATECSEVAECDGEQSSCPTPTPKTEHTPCNDFTQVCINGLCEGTICQKIQWDQCYIVAPENDKNFNKAKLCFVACKHPTTGKCVSTGDTSVIDEPENSALKTLLTTVDKTDGLKLAPGAPCDNFKGYCDVFQKCRGVDADGPLARLKNLLLNEETLNEIKDWIITYWWAVLLMGVGLVVFMGVFIKLCAVHTPSSNPKKAPARKLTLRPQPARHPRQQAARPPGYSGESRGGPPHGHGRGAQAQGGPPPYNPNHPGAQSYEMKSPARA